MEMTIDEAIKHGEEQLEIFGGEHNEFIQTAIDTMRKYQKIEEIVGRYGFESSWLCLRKIREVVGDGEIS